MEACVEAEVLQAWMMDSVVGVLVLSCSTDTSLGCWTPWQQEAPVQQQREPSRITDDAPTRSFAGFGRWGGEELHGGEHRWLQSLVLMRWERSDDGIRCLSWD